MASMMTQKYDLNRTRCKNDYTNYDGTLRIDYLIFLNITIKFILFNFQKNTENIERSIFVTYFIFLNLSSYKWHLFFLYLV